MKLRTVFHFRIQKKHICRFSVNSAIIMPLASPFVRKRQSNWMRRPELSDKFPCGVSDAVTV